MTKIHIEKTGNPASSLGYVGSILDVIAATLDEKVTNRHFKASDFAFGYGLASPLGITSLGETVILNRTCYVTSTDRTSSDYNKTIYGSDFMTGGFLLIPNEAVPSYKARLDSSTPPLNLIDCYHELYERVQEPLSFIGIIEFAHLHATALGKPPTNGHNIFTHKEEYYPYPDVLKTNTHAFIMGAITNFNDKQFQKVNTPLQHFLYHDPKEAQSEITEHSHIVTLKNPIKQIQEITPNIVDKTLHLCCDGSTIKSFQFDIFTIKEFKEQR